MTAKQTKQFINVLSKKWEIENKKFLFEIVDFLDKGIDKKVNFFNGFELSLIEGESKIRLLYLSFWQPNLSSANIKKILKERERTIISIFQQISQKFHSRYNLSLLQIFFQFNKKAGHWPIQFGFECQKNSKPKLKVYLSFNSGDFSWEEFCDKFKLNRGILNKKFKNKKFDTVAIDFSPDKDYCFKFYPLVAIDKGLLYRVDKGSRVTSIKIWLRFPRGLFIDDERINKFIRLPALIYKIIKDNNFKIHYLCEENGRKSIYFR